MSKDREHGVQWGTADRSRRAASELHEGWRRKLTNAEDLELWQDAFIALSDSVPEKRVTAVLHARADIQRASFGHDEELSRRC